MLKKYKTPMVHGLIFLFFFIYFSKLYPVIPYDGDDWYFAGAMRKPWPMWGVFNPTKVLPEVLEPLGGYLAAFLFYPITGDYVGAMTIAQSLIISIFITAFCFMYYSFLRERINNEWSIAIALVILFLFSFFVSFDSWGDHCIYFGFYTPDLNVFFNYQIPGLLNSSLVLFMSKNDSFVTRFNKYSSLKKGIILLTVYLSVFSSIQMSIILASYCSWKVISEISRIRYENGLMVFFKNMYLYFTILLVWLASLVFEMNGGRAKVVSDQGSFFSQPFSDVFHQLINLIREMNKPFLLCSLVLFILAVAISIISDRYERVLLMVCFMLIISFVYLFLVYAKAGGNYMGTPYGAWTLLCWGLILSNLSLAVVIERFEYVKILLPYVIVLSFIMTVNQNFRHNIHNKDYETCKAINEYIIEQIVTADKAGLNSIEVRVPDEHTDDNWPHPYNMANWMQNTLYAHHLINKRIKITFVPDDSVNEMFYTYDRDQMEPFSDLEVH